MKNDFICSSSCGIIKVQVIRVLQNPIFVKCKFIGDWIPYLGREFLLADSLYINFIKQVGTWHAWLLACFLLLYQHYIIIMLLLVFYSCMFLYFYLYEHFAGLQGLSSTHVNMRGGNDFGYSLFNLNSFCGDLCNAHCNRNKIFHSFIKKR